MILYHGTNVDFTEVDFKKSKPNKDFGVSRLVYIIRVLDMYIVSWKVN